MGRHALTLNGSGSAANINNKLKQMGVNSQMDMHDSIEPSSPAAKSKIAPDSDEDMQPRVELKNVNREGTISKPRAKRGSLPEM